MNKFSNYILCSSFIVGLSSQAFAGSYNLTDTGKIFGNSYFMTSAAELCMYVEDLDPPVMLNTTTSAKFHIAEDKQVGNGCWLSPSLYELNTFDFIKKETSTFFGGSKSTIQIGNIPSKMLLVHVDSFMGNHSTWAATKVSGSTQNFQF